MILRGLFMSEHFLKYLWIGLLRGRGRKKAQFLFSIWKIFIDCMRSGWLRIIISRDCLFWFMKIVEMLINLTLKGCRNKYRNGFWIRKILQLTRCFVEKKDVSFISFKDILLKIVCILLIIFFVFNLSNMLFILRST